MNPADVTVKQYAHMGPVLVDDHQARLGGRQDVAPLELQIGSLDAPRSNLRLLGSGIRLGLVVKGQSALLLPGALAFFAFKVGIQLIPVAHRLSRR